MEKLCVDCRSPKVESDCASCGGPVCRKCRVFLREESFPVAPELLPRDLKFDYYCSACYGSKIEPIKSEYESTLEQARNIVIIYKNSKSTVRILKKALRRVEVENIADRDAAILHLAFQAVKAGFNAVINTEVSSKKVRNEGYQTSVWEAEGLPADIKSHESERE